MVKGWRETRVQDRSLVKAKYISALAKARHGISVGIIPALAIFVQNQNADKAGLVAGLEQTKRYELIARLVNEKSGGVIEPVDVYQVWAVFDLHREVQGDLNKYAESP